jgi:hypothetical protein
MNHRDHINAVKAKRLCEELDDEEASRIEELLAADQQREHEKPIYQDPMEGEK